jgi:hypothetical protein
MPKLSQARKKNTYNRAKVRILTKCSDNRENKVTRDEEMEASRAVVQACTAFIVKNLVFILRERCISIRCGFCVSNDDVFNSRLLVAFVDPTGSGLSLCLHPLQC